MVGGGGVTLLRGWSPLKTKQKPLVVEKEEGEEERGGGVVFMVYDLQGEPRTFRFLRVLQIPESPVPSRAMLITNMLVSALAPPAAVAKPKSSEEQFQDHGQRRAAGGELVQGLAGGGGGPLDEV